jgi:hypothetical protein
MQPAKRKPLTPIAPSVGFPLRSAPPACLPIHPKTLSWQNGDAVLPTSVRNAADFCKRLGAFGLLAGFAVVFLVCFGIAFRTDFPVRPSVGTSPFAPPMKQLRNSFSRTCRSKSRITFCGTASPNTWSGQGSIQPPTWWTTNNRIAGCDRKWCPKESEDSDPASAGREEEPKWNLSVLLLDQVSGEAFHSPSHDRYSNVSSTKRRRTSHECMGIENIRGAKSR